MEQVSSTLTSAQKILLFCLYSLIALMIFFSLLALKDKNFAGYEKCLQKKCDRKGQDFCHKPREIMNCCAGAGGKLAAANNQYTCVFT